MIEGPTVRPGVLTAWMRLSGVLDESQPPPSSRPQEARMCSGPTRNWYLTARMDIDTR